jgi:tRNA(fMet)-specific endonuclease VapC
MRPRPDSNVLQRLLEVGDEAATAAPVWHEIQFGRLRLPRGRRRRAIDKMLRALESVVVVLPYDSSAARWHAAERVRLSKRGNAQPFVDGQIAAIAAVNDLTLVTRNVRDFAAFRGLHLENWFED